MKKIYPITLSFLSLTFCFNSFALTFNPNNVLSDYEMQNYNSMSIEDIQSFLDGKGYLGKMLFENYFGELSTAAEIIHKYSNQFQINPKYLLTTLQKEQSLIEAPLEKIKERDLDWAMGYSICDSCSKEDPLLQKYKGFDNQLYHAARRNREYYTNPEKITIQTKKPYTISNTIITPENQATVNLYTYTPHMIGVKNFFEIWNKYFTKHYPDGTLLAEKEKPGIWLIQDGLRRPFMNEAAFYTRYNKNNVIYTFASDIEKYTIGKPIKFPNYSLFRTKENGNIYMLDNDILRRISSMNIFKTIGFNTAEIVNVSLNDIGEYDIGEDINEKTLYPTGAILQDKDTKELWFVKNGEKYLIKTKEIYNIKYNGKLIIESNTKELSRFIEGSEEKLQDGTIIKGFNGGPIFIISNGERREIQTKELFKDLGYNENNIIKISDDTIVVHPLGFPLEKGF